MKTEEIVVDGLSVVLFGQSRESVIIYVHGQGGCAREAEQVANVAKLSGYQIIAMDLPEHGKCNDAAKFVPWDAVPEIARIAKYAASRWRRILVCGVSIGAWFSLYAFKDVCVDKYIFISPAVGYERYDFAINACYRCFRGTSRSRENYRNAFGTNVVLSLFELGKKQSYKFR